MFALAYRNIKRHKRRTILTLILVVFSSFLITTARFVAYGMHQEMMASAIRLSHGFIQVAAFGWLENKPIERALDITPELLDSLKIEGVEAISPRVEGYALASFEGQSVFSSILAADFTREKKITTMHTVPAITGKNLLYLSESENMDHTNGVYYDVVLGKVLANNLELDVGAEISLVTNQFDGSVGAVLARVIGIIETMDRELDSRVFMTLSGGQSLFGLLPDKDNPVRYTSLALGVKDYLVADKVFAELSARYPTPQLKPGEQAEESEIYKPVIHFWPDLIPGLFQVMEFDEYQNNLTWMFLILVMAIGVLITVQMSILERTREFGIMLAIGTRQWQLIRMVILETLIILLPGLILGNLGGIAAGEYMAANPISLGQEFEEVYAKMGMPEPLITAIVNLEQLWIAFIMLFTPSFLFCLLATRRISKIKPVEVIATI